MLRPIPWARTVTSNRQVQADRLLPPCSMPLQGDPRSIMRQTPQRPGSSFQDQYQQVTSDLLVDTVSPTRAAPNPFPLDVVNTSSQPAAAFVATSFPNPYIQQSSIATPQDKNPNTVSGAKAPPHGGLNASSDI